MDAERVATLIVDTNALARIEQALSSAPGKKQ
jgi:hypothetical protein